jgi:Mg-chelatase subunit ChlD
MRNSVTAIFEGNINIKDKKPARVTFDLSPNIYWIKDNREYPEVKITHSAILNGDVSPRIEAMVENKSIEDVKNMEIVASIYDGKDNVVAVSRTVVELLRKGEKTGVFFTWPIPFSLATRSCEKPSETLLLIDRSGSIALSLDSVKEAAKTFLSELKIGDKVGLISFATKATIPPDISVTTDFDAVEKAIDNISILKDGTQYTNIFDALGGASTELSLESESKKVMVVLTDGVPNRPANPIGPKNEEADMAYAKSEALKVADEAKKGGIEIFSIGLGKDVHADFLQKLASTPENSFIAPATSDLKNIYKSISSSICKETPARIEMNYKFND